MNRSESGQAAVLVAILFFFAFLALAWLAIDGAITYLGRRDLQNVADAAALSACTNLANSGTAEQCDDHGNTDHRSESWIVSCFHAKHWYRRRLGSGA